MIRIRPDTDPDPDPKHCNTRNVPLIVDNTIRVPLIIRHTIQCPANNKAIQYDVPLIIRQYNTMSH